MKNKNLKMYPKIILIMGPTASEKTKLAIKLKKKFNFEIISVDSTLIYRDMDIGTNKPSLEERKLAQHRLIDILDPSEYYSAFNFQNDALIEIKKIISSDKIPLLVGGSMFYFNVLLNGLSILPSKNSKIRQKILNEAKKNGVYSIYKKLKKIDIESAKKIHPNDFQRLSRALEIFLISGKNLTELKRYKKFKFPYRTLQIKIMPDNLEILNKKIELRFFEMLKKGFEEEVLMLYHRKDLNKNLPSIKSIGYRQMWSYLNSEINYNEMIKQSIHATKILAKHQITWLKKWNKGYLFRSNDINGIFEKIKNFIEY